MNGIGCIHVWTFALDASGKIVQWHYAAGIQLNVIEEPDNKINCVIYDSSGFQMASGGSDRMVRVYDTRKNVVKYSAIHGYFCLSLVDSMREMNSLWLNKELLMSPQAIQTESLP